MDLIDYSVFLIVLKIPILMQYTLFYPSRFGLAIAPL